MGRESRHWITCDGDGCEAAVEYEVNAATGTMFEPGHSAARRAGWHIEHSETMYEYRYLCPQCKERYPLGEPA